MKNESSKRAVRLKRVFLTAAVLATVAFIFRNSMYTAQVSGAASQGVLSAIRDFLTQMGLDAVIDAISELLIRKAGHFLEYALLGFWTALCLRSYTQSQMRDAGWAFSFVLLTALSDETIQLFVEGRSGMVPDIWIDFAGAAAGMLAGTAAMLLHARKQKGQSKRNKPEGKHETGND